MELEDELENLKLKYSDADVEYVINSILGDSGSTEVKMFIIEEFKNIHILKFERENGAV
jgi:activator of 2-hydroxyglutaryl-CoA dehydratase